MAFLILIRFQAVLVQWPVVASTSSAISPAFSPNLMNIIREKAINNLRNNLPQELKRKKKEASRFQEILLLPILN